jgi:hypothetical protein
MGGAHSGQTADEDHPDNVKVEHEGWNNLREKTRGCTDCCCLVPLIGSWVGLTFIGLVVCGAIYDPHLIQGNPARLTHATDFLGNICGRTSGYKDKPYGYYLPSTTAICINECPSTTDYYTFFCEYNYTTAANNNAAVGYSYVAEQKCMYQIETKKYLNRCIPTVSAALASEAAASIAQGYGTNVSSSEISYAISYGTNSGWFSSFLGNLYNLRGYIFGFGMGVTVGVAFIYLLVLRIPHLLFFTVWFMVIGIFCLLITGSLLLWDTANNWAHDGVHSSNEVITLRVFCWAGVIISGLYFCVMIVLRKRINLAVGVIQQAALALESMPTLLVVPVLQAIGLCCFLAPWLTYLLYLASSGEVQQYEKEVTINNQSYTATYSQYTYSKNAKYIFLYMLFTWFWTSEFLVAFGQLVVAMSFAGWYFTRNKSEVGAETVRWAFQEVGVYHLGTAAFGSLIIAVVKTIRAVIAYIQKKAQKSGNKVMEYIMCMLQCLMWCLEKILKFINKHAYIITAIYGYSFCHAARKSFFLLLRNILRVAAVNMISGFMMFIWKFSIPVLVTFLTYLGVTYGYSTDTGVSDIVAPLVITFFISYWVACMFLDIFAMGIETILFCFIADEEMFDPEHRFAEGELTELIHATAKAHAESKGRTYDPSAPASKPAKNVELTAVAQPKNADSTVV